MMDKRSIYPAAATVLALFMTAVTVDGRRQSKDVNSSTKGEVVGNEETSRTGRFLPSWRGLPRTAGTPSSCSQRPGWRLWP